MRFILKTVFALVTLAVLAAGAVAFLVPEDVVRDRAVALVKQHTGRDLAVRGKTSFALFPSIGVELDDVTLSNPPNMGGGAMLRMESLTLSLKLLPLISRSVEVERFVLVRPVFELRVDAEGRRNWDFSNKLAAPQRAGRTLAGLADKREPPARYAQATAPGGGLVQDLRLGTVRIEEGVVLYANARNGASHRLDAVNLSLQQDALSEPLNAEGDFVWNGEKVAFDGEVGSPTAFIRGGSSAVTMAIDAALAKGRFTGRLVAGDALAAEGDLSGETPSVRGLAAWTGSPLAHGKGLGSAALDGRLKFQGDVLTFEDLKFSLDGMKGQGNGSVSLKGARPYLRAAFAVDTLDLNKYIGPAGPAPAPRRTAAPERPAPAPAPQPQADAEPKDGQSLTDFIEQLNKPPPQVRAWSKRAMDFAGLRAVDADVNVNAGSLLYDKIKIGASAVSASLKGGVLTANLTKFSLYEGAGTGRVTLNGARAVPAFAVTLDLKDVAALPLLTDAIKFDRISGSANLAVNLSGTGRTESEMVATLQGNGSIRFTDGAIEGINIPEMIRKLKQGEFGGLRSDKREKTDFSSLTGTFTMQNGVATNSDLNLVGPLLRMTGEGTVTIPREQLDFALSPRLVANLQGQGAEQGEGGMMIPVRVHGPWGDPKIKPDLERIIENPQLTQDAAKKLGKAFKKLKGKKVTGEQVEQLLQGVLGGGRQPEEGQPAEGGQAETEKDKPEELLKKFFQR